MSKPLKMSLSPEYTLLLQIVILILNNIMMPFNTLNWLLILRRNKVGKQIKATASVNSTLNLVLSLLEINNAQDSL